MTLTEEKGVVLGQKWTIKKILCYLIYRLIGVHLPDSEEFGPFGRLSQKFRRTVCRPLFKETAKVIGVGKGINFGNGSNIIMKDHANLGSYSCIEGSRAIVTVGRHVMMGKFCIIILQNHKYISDKYDGFEAGDIVIDDYAWIGHKVTILPGVRIGKHAIVGAGAVVTKSVPDYAVAVGNPAVIKKYRKVVS